MAAPGLFPTGTSWVFVFVVALMMETEFGFAVGDVVVDVPFPLVTTTYLATPAPSASTSMLCPPASTRSIVAATDNAPGSVEESSANSLSVMSEAN